MEQEKRTDKAFSPANMVLCSDHSSKRAHCLVSVRIVFLPDNTLVGHVTYTDGEIRISKVKNNVWSCYTRYR